SRWPATARTCGRLPGAATTRSRTGPDEWRIDDESGARNEGVDRTPVVDGGGRLRRQEAADRPADAASGPTDEHGAIARCPGAARAGRRTDHRSARAGQRRCDLRSVARRSEQELAAESRVLRARQQ